MELFYKIVALLGEAIVILYIYQVAKSGRVAKKRNPGATSYHKGKGRALLFLTLGFVVFIEAKVRFINGGVQNTDLLFKVHLSCAIGFVVGLVALAFLGLTGEKTRLHAPAAWLTLFGFGPVMIITGVPLILLRF